MCSSRILQIALLCFVFFALLYFRRSAQLLHPQVWDEDGTKILPGLLSYGLPSLFYPVNGYLLLVPKLIAVISLAISGLYFPFVSTILAWIVVIAVCLAVSLSPISLRGGALLGIATLLIPSDPEVFGIPLYTFWWTSLLLYLLVLWKPESRDWKWRMTFTVAGGLSSPIIFLVTPFLAVRAVAFRRYRRELAVLAVALLCCVAQGIAMLHSSRPLGPASPTANLGQVFPKFIGDYFAGNFNRRTSHLVWIAIGCFLSSLILAIPLLRRNRVYLYLVALWVGTVYFVARRIDLFVLQPRTSGPRYFFLPFVLLSWFLVSVLVESKRPHLKVITAALLLWSVVNMWPVRSRPQQDFHWAAQVSRCNSSDLFNLAISYDGMRPWYVSLNAEECRKLQNAGLFKLRSNRQ